MAFSRTDSDWINSKLQELTEVHNDFVTLVSTPPLILEQANIALIYLTAQLVCPTFICSQILYNSPSRTKFLTKLVLTLGVFLLP